MSYENELNLGLSLVSYAETVVMDIKKTAAFRAHLKGNESVVTVADKMADRIMVSGILAHYDDSILSEEQAPIPGSTCRQWYVDPLDGTKSFIYCACPGQAHTGTEPNVAITLSLYENNSPLVAIVRNPFREEWFYWAKGEAPVLPEYKASSSDLYFQGYNSIDWVNGSVQVHGSVAYHLVSVACGRIPAYYLNFNDEILNPWDISAGVAIVKAAGMEVTDLEGNEINISASCRGLLAAHPKYHKKLIEKIKSKT